MDGTITSIVFIKQVSWHKSEGEGIIKVGHGLLVGENVIMEKIYPAMIDIKYLGIFNGFGAGGQWKLFTGIHYQFRGTQHLVKWWVNRLGVYTTGISRPPPNLQTWPIAGPSPCTLLDSLADV